MFINEYISRQFAFPKGIGGKAAAKLMNGLNEKHYKAVNKYVNKNNGSRILDIGVGNGFMLKILSKYPGVKLYGIDVSMDMLENAQKKNKDAAALNKIMLSQASVTELPYNDEWFDTIYTVNTIYFWGDVQKGFEEVFRTLKKGGNFICTFYSKQWLDDIKAGEGYERFEPGQLRKIAQENGFVNVKIKIIKRDKAYFLIGEKL